MAHGWKMGVAAVVAMVLAGVTVAQRASAAPPKIVKVEPDNGATLVDPTVREIRVTFDQDMSTGGFSWTGGGETYPKLRGRPQWADKRTCVLPVDLEPNHKYQVGINSPSHKNFRSAGGEPAEWYRISFETGAGSGRADAAKNWAQDVKAAADELRRAVDQRYSYRDLRGVDWDKRFGEYRQRLLSTESPQQFATVAAELLGVAKDIHITVAAGDQTLATFRRRVAANMNLQTLARVVPDWMQRSNCVWTGRFPDGIGYIQIGSWSRDQIDALERAFEALDDFADTKAIIVDVRGNSGGSEPLAAQFAGCFVAKPAVYSKHTYRDASRPDGFSDPRDRTIHPKRGRPKYRGKVAVLMGPVNMSSCESFLLMMKHGAGATLVGQTSYGSSGNPKPNALGNGVTVFLPSWRDLLPDGTLLEGKGIQPDVAVETTPESLARDDAVLQAALKALREP